MLRRGFKTEAETIAAELRTELGLVPQQRLDPKVLAQHLAVPVFSLGELRERWAADEEAIRTFLGQARSHFSAATVTDGSFRLIIYNETHSDGRLANSLAHELAHIVLGHEPTPIRDEGGLRLWNQEAEEEADWLAGTLLVPRDGALILVTEGYTISRGAAVFGVSEQLFRQRVNQTGVRAQVQARRPRAR